MTAKRLDIQGLRAIAVLLVIAFHAGVGVPGGFVGVDVFFVISGFVISSTLVRELERNRRIDLPRFYVRRVKRLLPALAVMLTVVALAGVLLDPAAATRIAGLTGIFASFFTANLYLWQLPTGYFDVSTQLDPLLHTWTLAVEEQFYVVFPVALFAAWRVGGRRVAIGAITLLGCGSLAVALIASASFSYYGAPARAWEFAAGCLASLVFPKIKLPVLACSALGALGVGALILTAGQARQGGSLLTVAVIPVAAACVLIVAGTASENIVSQALASRPLARIGDLSYSLYLWHWPLIVFARAVAPGVGWAPPAAAFASAIPAWLSYRYIENPIRLNPRIVGRYAVALTAACVAIPITAALAQLNVNLAPGGGYASGLHADVLRGCDRSAPLGDPTRPNCTWRTPHPHGTAVLIGDSNAGHFTEPFVRAANQAGYDATVATISACPFVQLRLGYPNAAKATYAPCQRFDEDSLKALLRLRPSLVVISSRADRWISEDFELGRLDSDAALSSAPSVRAKLWAAGIRDEVAALNRKGIPVVVIDPVPVLPADEGACAVVLLRAGRCRGQMPRTEVDELLGRTLAAQQAAVAGLPDAQLMSVESAVCGPRVCSSRRDGVDMYRDSHHLSVAGALTLTGRFEKVIRQNARRIPLDADRGRLAEQHADAAA